MSSDFSKFHIESVTVHPDLQPKGRLSDFSQLNCYLTGQQGIEGLEKVLRGETYQITNAPVLCPHSSGYAKPLQKRLGYSFSLEPESLSFFRVTINTLASMHPEQHSVPLILEINHCGYSPMCGRTRYSIKFHHASSQNENLMLAFNPLDLLVTLSENTSRGGDL